MSRAVVVVGLRPLPLRRTFMLVVGVRGVLLLALRQLFFERAIGEDGSFRFRVWTLGATGCFGRLFKTFRAEV